MSVHHVVRIAAPPQQVFELLTSGSLFSAATGMPAEITNRQGDPFSIFGGRVEGRQIELVPGQRVVQAWRFGHEHGGPTFYQNPITKFFDERRSRAALAPCRPIRWRPAIN
jgi:uncharacterized protein YndB with AHSA1/START domain